MIRTFQPADLTAVMQIWLNANLKAHNFIPADYWKNHFEHVKKLLPDAELYVYEKPPASLYGFIGMAGDYIAGIFVEENARSKGIGKQLLDHAKSLRQNLTLNVYQKNERAVSFYLREGFRIHSQAEEDCTNETEYFMKWRSADLKFPAASLEAAAPPRSSLPPDTIRKRPDALP